MLDWAIVPPPAPPTPKVVVVQTVSPGGRVRAKRRQPTETPRQHGLSSRSFKAKPLQAPTPVAALPGAEGDADLEIVNAINADTGELEVLQRRRLRPRRRQRKKSGTTPEGSGRRLAVPQDTPLAVTSQYQPLEVTKEEEDPPADGKLQHEQQGKKVTALTTQKQSKSGCSLILVHV